MIQKALSYVVIAGSLLVPACRAQALLDQLTSVNAGKEGPRLYEVSVFSGYSTSANPTGAGQFINPGTAELGADVNYGAGASLGWQHHRERTNFSVRYSGTYMGLVQYTGGNGFSQSLSLSVNRKLSPKWNVGFSASGQDSTLAQLLNEPSPPSIIAQLPSDFNNFAAAYGLGNFSTSQAASMILGAPVVQTPVQALLLGSKMLTYSGNASVTYAYSRHLSFYASSLASGGQNRSSGQNELQLNNYLTPFNFGGSAGTSWSSSSSPRTQWGASMEGTTSRNHFQDSYGETATASLGRKMGEHWFFRMYGGATITQITQQLSGTARTLNAVGGGSLGLKTYMNTFVASYDRSASNTYGIVGTYTTMSGTWNRRHPGSRFSTFTSFGQQQMRNTGFESFSGWQASAGFSEQLIGATVMRGQYAYVKTASNYLGAANNFSAQSIRLSMSWSPQPAQH